MRIAVIDDGVNQNALRSLVQSYRVINGRIVKSNDDATVFSHGTACAKLIEKRVNDLEIVSIKIYNEEEFGNEKDLCDALSWCLYNNIDFINLSNGIVGYFDNERIMDCCYKLREKGVLIIAAINKCLIYTSPAHLPYTISVSNNIKNKFQNRIINADIVCNGYHAYFSSKKKLRMGTFTSFACARMSNKMLRSYDNIHQQNGFRRLGYSMRLNIFDVCQLKNRFFFPESNLEKEYGEIIESNKSIENWDKKGLASIFVFADSDLFKVKQLISDMHEKIYSIIWCGRKIDRVVKKLCIENNIWYWDESVFEFNSRRHISALAEPLIVIENSENAFIMAWKLKKRFEKDGYHVLLFSNKAFSYLFGAFYTINEKRITNFSIEYEPDVVILLNDIHNVKLEVDISLIQQYGHIDMCHDGEIIKVPDDFETVYFELLKLLTNENN